MDLFRSRKKKKIRQVISLSHYSFANMEPPKLIVRKYLLVHNSWYIGKGWENFGLHHGHELFEQLRQSRFIVERSGNGKGWDVRYDGPGLHPINPWNLTHPFGRHAAKAAFESILMDVLKVEKAPPEQHRRLGVRNRRYMEDPVHVDVYLPQGFKTYFYVLWRSRQADINQLESGSMLFFSLLAILILVVITIVIIYLCH